MKSRLIAASCLLLLLAGSAWAGESGSALKNDTLRVEPYGDAKTAGTLNRGDKVDILEKKGAWLKVKTGKSMGWVRLLSIKRGAAAASNDAAGLLSVASGRAGTGQVVSTTGVRGLSEEELKSAKFNEVEVSKLEADGISPDAAKAFADAGGLQARKLAYLPEPKGGAR